LVLTLVATVDNFSSQTKQLLSRAHSVQTHILAYTATKIGAVAFGEIIPLILCLWASYTATSLTHHHCCEIAESIIVKIKNTIHTACKVAW